MSRHRDHISYMEPQLSLTVQWSWVFQTTLSRKNIHLMSLLIPSDMHCICHGMGVSRACVMYSRPRSIMIFFRAWRFSSWAQWASSGMCWPSPPSSPCLDPSGRNFDQMPSLSNVLKESKCLDISKHWQNSSIFKGLQVLNSTEIG